MVLHAIHEQGTRPTAHFHDPIWGLTVKDNVYLIFSLHDFFHADRKMTILGTELLQITF